MSRPLTGTKTRTASGWKVSLPVERGSTKRVTRTFDVEADADRWRADGIAIVSAGGVLAAAPASRPGHGTAFETIADAWRHEYFVELNQGRRDRERTVERHIVRITAYVRKHHLVLETMNRAAVKGLMLSLTKPAVADVAASVPPGVDADALVTLEDAAQTLPEMASKSTLKRRKKEGLLAPAQVVGQQHLFRVGDLYADAVMRTSEGGLRRGPRTNGGALSGDVARDCMWVFERVCAYARDHGIDVPDPGTSLKMPRVHRARIDRQPVPLDGCAQVAGRLHVVHQLVLWLLRVLGLRISEAYGIRVEDVLDLGPGNSGALTIRAQGGRRWHDRDDDGRIVTSTHVDRTKTDNSLRVLVVPSSLMDVIRTVVDVFHTDENGTVRSGARLVPGLARADEGGQEAFRSALARASREVMAWDVAECNVVEAFSWTPHNMRRTLLSDLDRHGVKDTHIQQVAGHAAGTAVLHRHYLLADPKLRPAREIAELVEQEIRAEVPRGLMVPTTARCTTKAQRALAPQAPRIDTHLTELGWLVTPQTVDGADLLNAGDVAGILEVTVQTARRWMADGRVPSVPWNERARGVERRSVTADVLAVREYLRSQVPLTDLADELGRTYAAVLQHVMAYNLELSPWGAREYTVPTSTAEAVRRYYRAKAALDERAVSVSVAAQLLGVSPAQIKILIADGVLEPTAERGHAGARMVTRRSVNEAQCRRGGQ